MKKTLRWLLAMITVAGLVGCGLKGPLYFPPVDKSKAPTVPSDNADSLKAPLIAERK